MTNNNWYSNLIHIQMENRIKELTSLAVIITTIETS